MKSPLDYLWCERVQTRTPQENLAVVNQMNKTTTISVLKVLNTFFLLCYILRVVAFIDQI